MPERQIEGKKLCQSISEELAEEEMEKGNVIFLHFIICYSLRDGVQLLLSPARRKLVVFKHLLKNLSALVLFKYDSFRIRDEAHKYEPSTLELISCFLPFVLLCFILYSLQ